MSLTGAITASASGLKAQQSALQLAGSNIANVNTAGYTRKSQTVAAGALPGSGVQVLAVTRSTDQALAADLYAYQALAGRNQVQSDYLASASQLFGGNDGSARLATAAEDLVGAWTALQAVPDQAEAQSDAIAKADSLARTVNDLAAGVDSLDRRIADDTGGTVDQINGLLARIADLNHRITAGRQASGDTVELEDQRDAGLKALAELIDVKPIPRGDGSVAVYSAGGLTLVDQTATRLSYDGTDLTRAGDPTPLQDSIRGGRLAGLLALRAPLPASGGAEAGRAVIAGLRGRLDAFASQFTATTGSVPPTTLADAYDDPTLPTAPGELAAGLFVATGTPSVTLSVNPALLDGTARLKSAAIAPVVGQLTAAGRSLSAGGLTLAGRDYSGLANGITAALTSDAGNLSQRADLSAATRDEADRRLTAATGVDLDQELANLQLLQNAYSASARVITIVNQMFDQLFNVVR